MSDPDWTPVTHASCGNVKGPFYHGTKYRLEAGDLLVPGFASNFEEGRISNNVYFSALLEPAVWGAELATALAGGADRGYIYIVEPTGSFEDDPNLTNKRFPGNPTQSYRTRHPLSIVGEVKDWEGHPKEVLQQMLDGLKEKIRQGLAPIED
ncbi:rifampin ADP-ribosylating transferase ARR-2 [Massilia sp. Root351]|jgi:rifampin ADP-ribosylating transferase|uniref:NAD(+)--rifampin ADP-ribosyltransferase n=1 Tax=Massilia sp. Root351 TaxID=1736522 RepID=UPI00070DDB45|nr:NAD(+)--rifampin ADP-ribosyltransferase [Massilia sp. Root351]KQV87806.1 rifampin ADP-ribosylating transferase ARR-2 [Massilia sp. Root351]